MIVQKYPVLFVSAVMTVLAASGMAAEQVVDTEKVAVDWRLELLSREGASSETPAFQEMEKRLSPSEEGLEKAVGRLGAE
ncbi:MAG: hypothetical protein WCJ66_10415, partial [Verrucomicrobiota bacterium]